MKNNFRNLLLLTVLAGQFASCKKDEVRAVMQAGTKPALTASASSIVLDTSKASTTVETFSWTASDFGYKAAVAYTLQFAKAGTNFASVEEVSVSNAATKGYTGADMNQLALKLGLAFNTAAPIDVRVKASVGSSVAAPVSNVVTFTVMPYQVIVNYPSLYVPGDYWNPTWTPDKSPKVSSKTNNGAYEGYVYFANASSNFKFTSDPDWNHTNYGDGGTGKLSASGSAGNLAVSGAGYYRVAANTNDLTWSATKTTWGIIGNAPTASNNWSSDVAMTYNTTTQVWTVTTNMVAGEFKFRANADWNNSLNNFGDNAPADGVPDYNGSNIAVTAAGNYTVTLDLHIPGNYTYTIRKN